VLFRSSPPRIAEASAEGEPEEESEEEEEISSLTCSTLSVIRMCEKTWTISPSCSLRRSLYDDDDEGEGEEEAETEAEEDKEAAKEDDDEITDVAQIKQQASKVYFRKRLQFYDKTLFSYSKTHPSLKKYPSMCAANALKQPTVMTEDEYERMKDLYSKEITEGTLLFIEYPVKKGTSIPDLKTKDTTRESIVDLRYG